MFSARRGDDAHAPPAALDEPGVVGRGRQHVLAGAPSARSSAARRKTCGVCTDHSVERSSVRTTAPSVRLLDRVGHRRGGDRRSRSRARRARRARPGRSPASRAGGRRRGRSRGRPRRPAARRSTDCERCSPPVTPIVPAGACAPAGSATTICVDRAHRAQRLDAPFEHRTPPQRRRTPWAPRTQGVLHVPRLRRARVLLATATTPALSASRSSRCCSASSSSLSSAYISSEARIFFARVNICFSPVDRPFSCSRIARLRTTSASS